MWNWVTGSLRPGGGGGIAGMAVGSQWCSWASRVYRAAVMMCLACPSGTMWRSVPKSFGRWAAGWMVMWTRAGWMAFFPLFGTCDLCPLGCVGVGVFLWGRYKGEGLYPVQGDGVFPGPVRQDVYAWVPCHGAQVHVARDGGGRERLAQERAGRGEAGRVVLFTSGVVDAVSGDVYGEESDGVL